VFDPYRKFVSCVFCGSREVPGNAETQLTKEHLFGAAFAQYLDVKGNWTALGMLLKSGRPEPRMERGSSPIASIAPRLLCKPCNNARLKTVMDGSLPLLKLLCDGQAVELTDRDRTKLRRYFERFAAIVDVCTSTEQVAEMSAQKADSFRKQLQHQNPALLGFAYREAYLAGVQLADVTVYLGNHTGVVGTNPDFTVVHPPNLDGSWKRITFVIRQLAICLDIRKPSLDVPESFSDLSEVASFPIGRAVTYDDYLAIRNQDFETLYWRTLLRFPEMVKEWEDRVRARK
jgi:hypothetical protein